ncbi:MAG TPA: anti-virulence regulator CigR family protein [Magnetospirillum sp.]|nr:anti-virulence regulator CigR family protein [Magnetospirillum sp.]
MQKIAFALAALLAAAAPAAADPGGHHRDNRREENGGAISAAESALIHEYYQSHAIPAADLPPGIRKKVVRGKPLPPGIAKRFPNDLSARLPARPGYDWRTVGADVVLIKAATGAIVDIVKDILH